MANLKPGELDQRVEVFRLESQSIVDGPKTGDIEGDWVSLGLVWAKVEPFSSSRDVEIEAGIVSTCDCRVTIRYQASMFAERLRFRLRDGSVLNALGFPIDPEMSKDHIEFYCVRVS